MRPAEQPGEARRRPYWLWPLRPTPRMADDLFRLAGSARPLLAGWRWPLTALAVGLLPLAVSYWFGLSLHHLFTTLLLAPLLMACACDDRQAKFIGLIVVVGIAHSALAIWLAAHDPEGAAVIFPESAVYWNVTEHWVRTGENPDYEPSYWVPLQFKQLGGLLVTAYTTFGMVPLYYGLRQLDVMNYYVGRLITMSHDPLVAIAAGWHPWSFLRVLGYALLLYEVVSWSLQRFTGRTLSTPRRRLTRWAIGLTFCFGDGVVKYLAADWIRLVLYDNLTR